jgi:putative lipoic acid-binding regulatory protein
MGDDAQGGVDLAERERTLALLREQHEFPGAFGFRVVIRPGLRATVVQTVVAVLDDDALGEVHERTSRKGNYVALRLRATCASAEQVLEVYEVLQRVDGVLAVL